MVGANVAYLDHNATAPVRPEVIEAVTEALRVTGNPSSVHSAGRAARKLVEDARREVAALVGAEPADVTLTSGGTEANALALARRKDGEILLASAIEHPSVLGGGRFPAASVETLPVTPAGVVDLAWLEKRLSAAPVPAIVSVMLANSETGAIQPVREVARLARDAGTLVHCDAVQAAGRLEIDIAMLGVDYLTLSAHKIGGPQGAGALVRRDKTVAITPLYRGGGQERSQRPGTEAVAVIAGFGVAARLAAGEIEKSGEIAGLRDWFESALRTISPGAVVFAGETARLANTSCFAVEGISAETAMISLDLDGVCVSSGSACSSGKVGASHVLSAMGVSPDLASGAIRVSLGWSSEKSDVESFIKAWRRVQDKRDRRRQEVIEAA
ncbi:cysteine desulfurase family protein [Microbaculum marinisediminis]|uniref:Cysteine desulfurase n=1 Tax=Microbaculum marinisediminis TaxID=2931392 RepID=A0AAW5R727_9HYPH|nr:cysteine desulfurase family protein [Microbaculum sp. A6E488]MCT8974449.1 cysteine desulfurase [Microbaculum sp. A6E488]